MSNPNRIDVLPLLKWAGKKLWLAPFLSHVYWGQYSDLAWFSPFAGGLGEVYGVQPLYGIVSDTCPHVVELYQWIKANNGYIPSEYRFTYERDFNPATYLAKRDRLNECIRSGEGDVAERSMLFYYLIKSCFNGLARFTKKEPHTFNTSMGRYSNINYPSDFQQHARVLRHIDVFHEPYSKTVLESGYFTYADPPYYGQYDSYSGKGLGSQEHEEICQHFAQAPGPVLVSNAWDEDMLKLYRSNGFTILRAMAPSKINCKAEKRGHVPEMLAYKNIPAGVISDAQNVHRQLFETPF